MAQQRPRILIIDDNPTIHIIIEAFLADQNCELIFASSGADGLDVLTARASEIDVVLLDRVMTGMDGTEVLRRIKAGPDTALIPVVFLTALGKPHEIAEGIKAGCFYYLSKPIEPAVLSEVVAAALTHHASQKSLNANLQRLDNALEGERHETHQATMMATYHYLNNALNQFQLVLLQLETRGHVDKEILQAIKESILKTATDMRDFGQMKNPTRANVEKFIQERL